MNIEHCVNRAQIIEVIHRSLSAFDRLDWERYKACFVKEIVTLDFSSLSYPSEITGSRPYIGSIDDFVNGIEQTVSGYDAGSHQISNEEVELIDLENAFFYTNIISTYYLGDQQWSAVGFYKMGLKKINSEWKISTMTFQKSIVLGAMVELGKIAKERGGNPKTKRKTLRPL